MTSDFWTITRSRGAAAGRKTWASKRPSSASAGRLGEQRGQREERARGMRTRSSRGTSAAPAALSLEQGQRREGDEPGGPRVGALPGRRPRRCRSRRGCRRTRRCRASGRARTPWRPPRRSSGSARCRGSPGSTCRRRRRCSSRGRRCCRTDTACRRSTRRTSRRRSAGCPRRRSPCTPGSHSWVSRLHVVPAHCSSDGAAHADRELGELAEAERRVAAAALAARPAAPILDALLALAAQAVLPVGAVHVVAARGARRPDGPGEAERHRGRLRVVRVLGVHAVDAALAAAVRLRVARDLVDAVARRGVALLAVGALVVDEALDAHRDAARLDRGAVHLGAADAVRTAVARVAGAPIGRVARDAGVLDADLAPRAVRVDVALVLLLALVRLGVADEAVAAVLAGAALGALAACR